MILLIIVLSVIIYSLTKNIILTISLPILVIIIFVIIIFRPALFNADFATRVDVRYHSEDIKIDREITDKNDVKELKRILRNSISYAEAPPTAYTALVSLTLTGDNKTVILCSHRGHGTVMRINESDRFIFVSKKEKDNFLGILKKYGMVFPCE